MSFHNSDIYSALMESEESELTATQSLIAGDFERVCLMTSSPTTEVQKQNYRLAQQLRNHLSSIRTNEPIDPNKFKGIPPYYRILFPILILYLPKCPIDSLYPIIHFL